MISKSVKTKLFIIMLVSIVLTSVIAVVVMYYGNENISNEILKQSIQSSMNVIIDKTSEKESLSAWTAESISTNEDFIRAMETGNKQEILDVTNSLLSDIKTNVEFVTITDAQGIAIARTHSDKDGDSVTNQKNIANALNGQMTTLIESGTEVKLSIRTGAPVKTNNGRLLGVVSTGYRLDTDTIVDNLKKITGTEITFFAGNTRVATTITQDGKRQVGTTLNEQIADIVLKQKQVYFNKANIFGAPYYTQYMPIIADDGTAMGVYFSGQPLTQIHSEIVGSMMLACVFVLSTCAILLFISSTLTGRMIVAPVVRLSQAATQLSRGEMDLGNLTHRSQDEIGVLTSSMLDMSVTIQQLVNDLNEAVHQHHLGNIDAFIDPNKYVGSYKEMAKSVNQMLAEYITAEQHTMDCVTQMVNGNFSAEMEQLPGKKAFINRAIEDLRTSLRSINTEVVNMVKNALAGNLSARIDTEKYRGDWVKFMSGLNEVLAATASPIQEALLVIQEMSKGNFEANMDGTYNGAFDSLKTSVNTTVKNVSGYIKEISSILNELANNNLDVEITREYVGEFVNIKDSLNNIVTQLNHVLIDINASSEQVAASAKSMSESSMSLAQGATQQASSVEELNATVISVNESTQRNAANAKKAEELSAQSTENASVGNDEMKQMLHSMQGIKDSSNDISKIIQVIDNIAFQTNLLALNAAVEAARAGEHGKGFAVVAAEVRNLASRSQSAASETTALIENSIQRVNEGTLIAKETAEALTKIVSNVSEVSTLISEISNASIEQAKEIAQINESVNQIADVVQNNSASSEESASTSQELSSQSDVLRSMIQIFKLKKDA